MRSKGGASGCKLGINWPQLGHKLGQKALDLGGGCGWEGVQHRGQMVPDLIQFVPNLYLLARN
jgi:hypothetical protein